MKRKLTVSNIMIGAGLIAILAAAYLFLWGKLFPFSPVIIGFARHELAHSVVYVQKGAEFHGYAEIDSCIPPVEAFHDLKFKKKPRLFIFRDRADYLRRSVSKARFCAFSGNSLVISPWALKEAAEGKISLSIYLRHELSHVLLFQYKGLLAELRYPNWLLEGIATYGANQMGTSFYPGGEETYALIRKGNFIHPRDFHTRREDRVKLDVPYRMTFMYSEFACIVENLIDTYGREKFLAYMKELFHKDNHDAVFREVFGIDFDIFIAHFRDTVSRSAVTMK